VSHQQRSSGDSEVCRHRLLIRTDARLCPGLQRRHAARRVSPTDKVLSGHCTLAQIRNATFLCLCAAHMLKAMSVRLSKVVQKKDCRALAMTYFVILQRTTDLTDAAWVYRHIATVLCSRMETTIVINARLQLEACVSGADVSEDDVELPEPPPIDDDATSPVQGRRDAQESFAVRRVLPGNCQRHHVCYHGHG